MSNLTSISEEELITKFREDELSKEELYSELFERYYPFLIKYGRRWLHGGIINEQELEDLVQSTFLDAFTDVRKYDLRISFRIWLINVFRSKASQLLSREKASSIVHLDAFEPFDEQLENIATEKPKVEDSLMKEDMFRALSELMTEELKIEESKLLMLHYVEGMTFSEIAKVLNKNPSAVRYDLSKVMAKIRYRLKKYLEKRKISLEDLR